MECKRCNKNILKYVSSILDSVINETVLIRKKE